MKKLLVLLMAACMSLGVTAEAQVSTFPRGDTPRWARVHERSGSGDFALLEGVHPVEMSVRVIRGSGSDDSLGIYLRRAGGTRDSMFLWVRPESAETLRVCWVYREGNRTAVGQECDG